ncbi:hypothetical protein OEV98_04035 [Caldibacillus lycopersici]|uniref:Uncharacterized protein n=1 Tax=Perspicuibacillus lycopersici TaxID=1325689 RepID=A0AAE3ITX9_9BACI|nr:hypothetical protein [Perspicuibacillus lycopersici]MCU9612734.1 hypothetical protein [Perspicuibacillus lycopersici]
MDKLFLVRIDETISAVVRANSKDEAFDIVSEYFYTSKDFYFIKDDIDEYTTKFYPGDCLFKNFLFDDDYGNILHFDNYSFLKSELKEGTEKYIWEIISNNVRLYFSEKPELADEYLRELKKTYETGDYLNLSKELKLFVLKRQFAKGSYFRIHEVDLSDTNIQLI